LASSETLVAKLAQSTPVNNPNGALASKNSIVPMTKIMDETGSRPVPLIGIRAGNMTRAGYHTFDVFVFIRCYTSLDKAFVENNEIMSLVNNLLDNQYISIQTAVTADVVLEQLGGEEYDEGYKLNYREGQFRLTVT
jgi:hypothetical protein